MHSRSFRDTMLSLGVVAATLIAPVAITAQAAPVDGRHAAPATSVSPVYSVTDGLARTLARAFADPAVQDRIVAAAARGSVDLSTLEPGSALAHTIAGANQAVLAAKGLPLDSGSVLQLQLGDASMRAALDRGEAPLVAATPTSDAATRVTAYDRAGHPVVLDATRVPEQPVLLVEVDVAKAMPIGLEVFRKELAARGIHGATPLVTVTGGYWATQIRAIRLSNDQEPWIKGAAEIFSVVTGWGFDGHPVVDTVQMPYLDYDGTTYYPNQLLVHFNSRYKYNLADVVMWEDDGDTNYSALAKAIADALLVLTDLGTYAPLVNAVIDAMPASWWTDDPDYTESWYTLSSNSSGRLYGASANGWMDVQPYWVPEL